MGKYTIKAPMVMQGLFGWLVEYHHRNLEHCLRFLQDGRILSGEGIPFEEGEENERYKGLVIIANGSTLTQRLRDGGVINGSTPQPTPFVSKEEVFDYFDGQNGKDGAYLLDSVNRSIVRIVELNNNPSGMPMVKLEDMIPTDFVQYHGKRVDENDLGNKTRIAIKVPQAYANTEAFLIKRSAYTPLGMGKVARFNSSGLAEEFFFMCEPTAQEHFVAPGIIGVHRQYHIERGRPVLTTQSTQRLYQPAA